MKSIREENDLMFESYVHRLLTEVSEKAIFWTTSYRGTPDTPDSIQELTDQEIISQGYDPIVPGVFMSDDGEGWVQRVNYDKPALFRYLSDWAKENHMDSPEWGEVKDVSFIQLVDNF